MDLPPVTLVSRIATGSSPSYPLLTQIPANDPRKQGVMGIWVPAFLGDLEEALDSCLQLGATMVLAHVWKNELVDISCYPSLSFLSFKINKSQRIMQI